MTYLEFLERLHMALQPRAYLEIGFESGAALRLSRTASIAVAPDARLELDTFPGAPWLKYYRESSDDFFRNRGADATLEGLPLDLAVIDGFHAFTQVVRDLEHIEHWGHADTVIVIHDTLPAHPWQASRAFHDGMWTGDVWRIVPFLQEYRRDLTCWLIDAPATGALVVTGLNPRHTGMAALAEEIDRDYPSDGPVYERLVDQWLQAAERIPPGTVLRALCPLPRAVGRDISGVGWVEGPTGWVATARETGGYVQIVLDEPILGSHRARLTLTARGMPVLRLQVHYAGAAGVPERYRFRNVLLDATQPGALMHGLDTLWLHVDPARCSFELDWEASHAPGEALTHITLAPLDFALRDTVSASDMAIDLQYVEVQQIAWPRPGTRYAPERFPDRPLAPKRNDGKRDAVVFAWWLPATPEAHKLGEYYVGLLRYHHADSRIFVGVNHGSDPEWIDLLQCSGLDVEITAVDSAVQMPSDVGGFLAALGAFSRDREAFDLVWFGHTKGASRATFDEYVFLRHQHDRRFWSRRADIDRLFADPKIGLFAHRYALHDPSFDVPWRGFADFASLQRVYRETYAPLGLWAWETLFVMRDEIVRRFCAAVGDDFFHLDPRSYGAGPWWFESAFPSIASMQGFEPAIELETDGAGNQRGDLLLYDDPRQTNRLAMEELERWRQNPFVFEPRALPRGYTRDPIMPHTTPS